MTRGNDLWKAIYHPFTSKLTAKLAQSHPDMPVFIIEGEYGALFTDPPHPSAEAALLRPDVGRVLTSIMAIAVLRAQSGVGPQVVSHVFGLRKAFEDGTAETDALVGREEGLWLSGDEGGVWLLEAVDGIVEGIGGGRGESSFAPARGGRERAKL